MNTTPLQNRALMLDAQANLLDATTQQPLLMASDWQLDAKAARQSLQEKQVDLAALEVLWVPTELVVFSQAVVPGKRASDAQKALPYVLEANLALPIEEYLIVVFEKHRVTEPMVGFSFSVALVTHNQMQSWHQALQALQLTQVRLVADCFRLPNAEVAQKFCSPLPTSVDGEPLQRCLVRYAPFAGFACDQHWGESIWQLVQTSPQALPESADKSQKSAESIPESHVSEKNDSGQQTVPTSLSFAQLPHVALDALLASQRQQISVTAKTDLRQQNLRQGPYANQAEQSGLLKATLGTLALGVALVSILLWLTSYQTSQLQAQATAYQQQTERLFQQMFPDVKRVVNIKAQTISRLKAQIAPQQDVELTGWLQAVESLMALVPEVTVQRLEWQANKRHLKLELQAKNSQQLARLSTLAKQRYADYPISITTKSVQPDQIEAQLNVR